MTEIDAKFKSLGGSTGVLGSPTGTEKSCPDNTGRFRHYKEGSIYWHPAHGAHEVHGDIFDKWAALGWEWSWLGYPTSDEEGFGDKGRVSRFENGIIEYHPDTGTVDKQGVGIVAYFDATHDQHQKQWEQLHPKWRIIALSVYKPPFFADARYAAVWTTEAGPDQVARHGIDDQEYEKWKAKQAELGFYPTLLSVAGTNASLFAVVAERVPQGRPVPRTLTGLWPRADANDPNSIARWSRWASENSYIPVSADLYHFGTDDLRAGIVFVPNDQLVAWNTDLVGDLAATKAWRDVYGRHGCRPLSVSHQDLGKVASIYRDDSAGPWFAENGLTAGECKEQTASAAKTGFYPVSVSVTEDLVPQFNVIFAKRATALPNRWSVTGQAVPELVAFDAAMKAYMTTAGIRAGALAIGRDKRLVYARGFTWGPSSYPVTQPASVFRIGSCTKALTSIVMHQLIANRVGGVSHSTRVVDLVTIDKKKAAPGFDKVTVEQLLTHTSGLFGPNLNSEESAKKLAALSGKSFASTTKRDCTELLSREPLGDKVPLYANNGYVILGAIIEALTGDSTFFQSLRQRVLAPLGLTRPTPTGGDFAKPPPGEVRYHLNDLHLAASVMEPNRPPTLGGYGDGHPNHGDSVGSLAFPAPDLVKILTCFDLFGDKNPILPKAGRDLMWPDISATGSKVRARGWGGFIDNTVVQYDHSGGLGNGHAFVLYRTDGTSLAVAFNRGGHPLRPAPWWSAPDRVALIESIPSWPTHDLFKALGIPSHK